MTKFAHYVVLALMFIPSLGKAQDFDAGVAAAQAGDFVKAVRELLPLAERGNPDAQYFIGLMYENGNGVPQDYTAAVGWYRLAAEHANVWAQGNLGRMYVAGAGVPQDFLEAERWFRLAAAQGSGVAQNNLGHLYARGDGVPQNFVTAQMWFEIAKANGDARAGVYGLVNESKMMPSEISEAQQRAQTCMTSNYKDCN